MEEKEDKIKKSNAYVQIMTGQRKLSAIDHFDGCMQWDITIFVSEDIKEKHNVLQKGISPNSKILQQSCTQGLVDNCWTM